MESMTDSQVSHATSSEGGEGLLREHERHMARFAGSSLRTACTLSSSRQGSSNATPSLAQGCADIRALDIHDIVPESDMNEMIASLESQIDRLSSLLDDFRSNVQKQLQAFREEIRNLPDHVGAAYTPRQRAHLQMMYGQLIVESAKLGVDKLQHDLTHLISLESDIRSYEEYCSPQSSFTSSRGILDSTASIQDQAHDRPSSPQLQSSLAQSSTMSAVASMSPHHLGLSPAEAPLDNHDERTANHNEVQHTIAEVENIALRPQREVIINWVRFCGHCPEPTRSSNCSVCRGWRRELDDHTWDRTDW